MKKFALLITLFLSACTYSITLVNSQGTSSDAVDETQNPTSTATAELPKIP